jgi:hypothetical protein
MTLPRGLSRWRLRLAGLLLMAAILAGLPLIGWRGQGKSAESRYYRIQAGMTEEDVAAILEGWTLGSGHACHPPVPR